MPAPLTTGPADSQPNPSGEAIMMATSCMAELLEIADRYVPSVGFYHRRPGRDFGYLRPGWQRGFGVVDGSCGKWDWR